MSVLETLLAAATTKTGAAIAGLTVAAGSAGAAGVLPDLPSAFDNAFGGDTVVEQVEDDDEASTDELTSEDLEPADTDDQGVAEDVHDVLTGDADVSPGDEGFGEAVSSNAREGGSEFGQSVAEAASDGRSSAGSENGDSDEGAEASQTGQEAADAGRQNADERSDGQERAEAGADNADDRAGNGDTEDYRPENPPEDAGSPEDAGPPEDAGAPEGTPGR